MKSLELKIPPPVQWLVFAVLTGLAARWLPAGNLPFPGHRLLAVLLAMGGVALAWAGMRAFRRARTTIHPYDPAQTRTIVSHGVYAYTRNPMYLGLALVLAAVASWWATAWGLLALALFCLCITRLQILPEERILQASFGEEYRRYRQRVRRWL